jgi:hypothetical protein
VAAVVVRVFTLWVGRPAFTGWLNHTYYYFVQVRGLLEQGSLPYGDMPLLFHLYALVARGLMAVGMESEAAIVASTRLVMCLVPALIALPVYGIVRLINGSERVRAAQWVLIGASAFLPLSLSYLPEFLQKNMFGLLLLMTLLFFTLRILNRFSWRDVMVSVALMLAIVLSHFGSVAAMMLYAVALALAYLIVQGAPGRALAAGLLLAVSGGAALTLIYVLDAQRFGRVLRYLGDSTQGSLVAALFSGDQRLSSVLASLGAILVFYALIFGAYRIYLRYRSDLSKADRTFWLASIFFSALVVLPFVEQGLMGRLAMFIRVPLLVVFIYVENYGISRPRLRAAFVALLAFATIMLAFGEVMSSRFTNANHEAIYADLRALEEVQPLGANDLVITQTGAEHICNWFYGVKAGVITSLTLEDFDRYDNVFVLNPIQGPRRPGGLEGRTAESEADRYRFMFRNIPRPSGVEALFVSGNVEFFRLDEPPEEWLFTRAGRWNGYRQ